MSRLTIVEGNTNDKDNVRAIMVKGEKGDKGDNGEITYSDVVDNLTSTETQKPLSAKQGKVLKGLIDGNSNDIDRIENDKLEVHYLSSGENFVANSNYLGSNIVITGTKNIIIDLGFDNNCTYLINFLSSKNITKIDAIIITHYHNDHIGGSNATGLVNLLSQNNIDFSECTVYLPHKNIDWSSLTGSSSLSYLQTNETEIVTALTNKNISYKYCDNEEIVNLEDNLQLQFFNTNIDYTDYYSETTNWNLSELSYAIYNNFSMVILMKHYNNYFLFTGDIEYMAQTKVYPYIKHCDVYTIEHHGLNYKTYDKYINQINPKYAILSDIDNLSPEALIRDTLNSLLLKGTKVYSTRTGGIITITSKFEKIEGEGTQVFPVAEIVSTIYGGNMLSANTDLDDITTVGTYHSPNATRTATMLNCPHAGSDFKLIVEQFTYNPETLKQTLMVSNSTQPRIWSRTKLDNVWSYWTLLLPSKYARIPFSEWDTTGLDRTHEYSADTQTYFLLKNGIITLKMEIKTTENISAYTYFIDIPRTIKNGTSDETILSVSSAFHDLILCNDNGDIYPAYLSTGDTALRVRTRKAIPSGTVLRGIACFSSLAETPNDTTIPTISE